MKHVASDSVTTHNSRAWDHMVAAGNRWTMPVSKDDVAAARTGTLSLLLTPTRPVPAAWYPTLQGCRVLGLAAGGGQQCPLLAAAGAVVTVFDNSAAQLAQDRHVAERESLSLRIEQGDMTNLGRFDDASFDMVFHPVSNCFVPDVRTVWREVFRVLRPGGRLLAGFANPLLYLFDDSDFGEQRRQVRPRHPSPLVCEIRGPDGEIHEQRFERNPMALADLPERTRHVHHRPRVGLRRAHVRLQHT